MKQQFLRFVLFVVAAFAAGLAGAYSLQWFSKLVDTPPTLSTAQNIFPTAVSQPYSSNNLPTVDFTEAADISTKAVVYIKTTSNQPQVSFNDWFFGDFFGNRQQLVVNSGSGVILSSDGYIVTNNHVVEKAVKVEIVLNDKQAYEAQVIGTDPSTDIALLKVAAKNLPTLPIANSNQVKVGEWVLAVGNPFNLTSTVTAGIVSAKGRNLNTLNNIAPIESFIQTDAAINPGNSGGALVNAKGELVGINTAILSRTGAYNGYGFAVPANIMSKVVRDLKEFGSVQRAFFGADILDIDAKLKEKLKMDSFKGVYVNGVAGYGPAKDAGIQEGDVLLRFNGVELNGKSMFDEQLSYYRPGEKVQLILLRNGKEKSLNITLTNIEGTTAVLKKAAINSAKLGADFEAISKIEKDKFNIEAGVRVSNIGNGYMARLGLRDGYIITHINKTPITTAADCIDILENIRGNISIEGIDKNGRKSYFSFYTY
jgi:Do/DeqQ family serine protease